MKLYLGPYEPYESWSSMRGITAYGRRVFGITGGIYLVWQETNGKWTRVQCSRSDPQQLFFSLEEAQQSLDTKLQEIGAIFLTKEQFEKLSVLT